MPRASGPDASFRTYEPPTGKPAIRFILALLSAASLLTSLFPALAQGGLYGPEAPSDISYVRVINVRPGEAITPIVAGEEWQPLEFAQVSLYRQLPPGQHSVSIAGHRLTLTTQPESFTTLILLEDDLLTLADTPLRDISRGLLTLYNLSDATLGLSTADGTEIISEVGPRGAASRTINQAEVGLVVSDGETRVAILDERLYERGEAHSVIVLPEGSEPRVIYARAAAG